MLGARRWDIYRRNGGYLDGEYQVTSTLLTSVTGALQPLSGRDLELIPESIRLRARFRLFVPSALNVNLRLAGENGQLSDMVDVDGELMELHASQQYDPSLAVGFTLQHREFVVVGQNKEGSA